MTGEDVRAFEGAAQKVAKPDENEPAAVSDDGLSIATPPEHARNQVEAERQSVEDHGPQKSNLNIRCPSCRHKIESEAVLCHHCSVKLSWIDGFPCTPGAEHDLQALLTGMRKATDGLPRNCPKCNRSRPGIHPTSHDSIHFAKAWAHAFSKHGICVKCCNERRSQRRAAEKRLRQFLIDRLMKLAIGVVAIFIIYKLIQAFNKNPIQ